MKIRRTEGFTLIELMIVIVVVAVLAAIAYPAYTNQVQKARRADATTALLGAAQQLERCFTRFNAYNDNAGCPDSFTTEAGIYAISIESDATSFTLTAAPQGAQTADPCGSFSLDHRGNRTPAPNANRCWGN